MSLRDVNLRYAALKMIADLVKAAMDQEKAAHLEQLEESADDSGARSWTVTLGGEKVAGLTLSQRSAAVKVTDEAAFSAWVAAHHPDMVETVTVVKPWAVKQLLGEVVDVVEDGGVTDEGELIAGVGMSEPGAPYQSLRWATGGKDVVAEAIRAGDLAELLEGTGLPLIGR